MNERMVVTSDRWRQLPGTGWQVLLKGKTWRYVTCGVEIRRTGRDPRFAGWNLSPVYRRVYMRRAPDGGRS